MRKLRFKSSGIEHTVYEELDGYRFECDDKAVTCVHWLSPEKYEYFLMSIGYPARTNLFAAIYDRAHVHKDRYLLAHAIHMHTMNMFTDEKAAAE